MALAFTAALCVVGTRADGARPFDDVAREALAAPRVAAEGLGALATDDPEHRQRLDVLLDWLDQDGALALGALTQAHVDAAWGEVGVPAHHGGDLASAYLAACNARRTARLRPYAGTLRRVAFTKHFDLGGSHYAYTEAQSDAQHERNYVPGASLCILDLTAGYGEVRTLLSTDEGVIRDPDVSYDGRRVLFSWKRSLDGDDYHLYEYDLASDEITQLTDGLGFADYEGAYLPDGRIVFNSTRCVQIVDCWWTEVSNLYTCEADGSGIRRLSYDQVHTNFPTVTPDGRVIYTRWDYNDRGQIYPQGLFEMHPDGTAQTETYGNNSWFPTAILHARQIPGSRKYVVILAGHHTFQRGWLGILDPGLGRQENAGAQLIAPVRETAAVRIDAYGQEGDQFQYPYPLGEDAFLVTMRPEGRPFFGIYVVFADGRRELLTSDPSISCNQPIPLAPRPAPPARPQLAGLDARPGVVYLQDVREGPGLAGVEVGAIKALRVVTMEFRAAGVGQNTNGGPAGGALASTPISIQGAWDVKRILGTTEVYEDGSACFELPSRTPVYFQTLDERGYAVQTMRSWVTLQPGESVSCVGCHEDKNTSPPVTRVTQAMASGPKPLEPWRSLTGETGATFDFRREVQPILDRHCVNCHDGGPNGAFSLLATPNFEPESLRRWSDSYLALANRDLTNWINVQSEPSMLPPYHAGSTQSPLMRLLESGHHGVALTGDELLRFATWIDLLVPYYGDYRDDLDGQNLAKYEHFLDKRRAWEAQEAENLRLLSRRAGR